MLYKIFIDNPDIKDLFEKTLGEESFKKLNEIGPQKFLAKPKEKDDNMLAVSLKKVSGQKTEPKKDDKTKEVEEYKEIRNDQQQTFDAGNKYEFPILPIEHKKLGKQKQIKTLNSAWTKQNINPYSYKEPSIAKQKIDEEFPSLIKETKLKTESRYLLIYIFICLS